jgi:hypothetical protein
MYCITNGGHHHPRARDVPLFPSRAQIYFLLYFIFTNDFLQMTNGGHHHPTAPPPSCQGAHAQWVQPRTPNDQRKPPKKVMFFFQWFFLGSGCCILYIYPFLLSSTNSFLRTDGLFLLGTYSAIYFGRRRTLNEFTIVWVLSFFSSIYVH